MPYYVQFRDPWPTVVIKERGCHRGVAMLGAWATEFGASDCPGMVMLKVTHLVKRDPERRTPFPHQEELLVHNSVLSSIVEADPPE